MLPRRTRGRDMDSAISCNMAPGTRPRTTSTLPSRTETMNSSRARVSHHSATTARTARVGSIRQMIRRSRLDDPELFLELADDAEVLAARVLLVEDVELLLV